MILYVKWKSVCLHSQREFAWPRYRVCRKQRKKWKIKFFDLCFWRVKRSWSNPRKILFLLHLFINFLPQLDADVGCRRLVPLLRSFLWFQSVNDKKFNYNRPFIWQPVFRLFQTFGCSYSKFQVVSTNKHHKNLKK